MISVVKTDTISDILLQLAAMFIFLSNLYLKQGIGLVYVMVNLHGVTRAVRSASQAMKISCPQLDSNPVSSAYEAKALTIVLRSLISIARLKVYRVLFVLCLEINL